MSNYIEERPWGSFENLLDETYCKVKRIIVKPGQRLSYQYHHKRSEAWVIVQGEACVTVDLKPYPCSNCTFGVGALAVSKGAYDIATGRRAVTLKKSDPRYKALKKKGFV